MKYWLYRIKKEDYDELASDDEISVDYMPEEIEADDLLIVHVSEIGNMIGTYKMRNEKLILIEKSSKELKLKDFYSKFSFIEFVNTRTYKMFAKKMKEITKEDYDMIESEL